MFKVREMENGVKKLKADCCLKKEFGDIQKKRCEVRSN